MGKTPPPAPAPKITRFRFVGGPLHNRLIDLVLPWGNPPGIYRVPISQPIAIAGAPAEMTFSPSAFRAEDYFLCRFRTERGCDFFQYIHESRMVSGTPDRGTCNETFARGFELDEREVRCRIWGAMKHPMRRPKRKNGKGPRL